MISNSNSTQFFLISQIRRVIKLIGWHLPTIRPFDCGRSWMTPLLLIFIIEVCMLQIQQIFEHSIFIYCMKRARGIRFVRRWLFAIFAGRPIAQQITHFLWQLRDLLSATPFPMDFKDICNCSISLLFLAQVPQLVIILKRDKTINYRRVVNGNRS